VSRAGTAQCCHISYHEIQSALISYALFTSERKLSYVVYIYPVQKTEINGRRGSAALTTRHPSIHKSWHKILSASGGRSVSIVLLRTKGHGVYIYIYIYVCVCVCVLLHEYAELGLYGTQIITGRVSAHVLACSQDWIVEGWNMTCFV
jgi:hypothetical protein